MITLSILFSIWGIVSCYRVNKICKRLDVDFNPFRGTFFDYLGIIIGVSVSIVFTIIGFIVYLP
jgi:hypothetical protein